MPSESRYRFDLSALYTALDKQRIERGITWRQVADEIGVAPSTIRQAERGGRMEADGVRAMVAWLCCVPEDFVSAAGSLKVPEPKERRSQTRAGHRRFDTTALYDALDDKRRSMELSWRQVAVQIGGQVTSSMLTRLRKGGRIEVNLMVAATGWLGVSVEDLTHETER